MRNSRAMAATVIFGVLLSPAHAALTYMTCQGLTTILQGPQGASVSVTGEDATLSLSIDGAAGTVTVAAKGSSWSVPITSLPNDDLVIFATPGVLAELRAGTFVGVSSGTINRITGGANIYIKLPNKTATQFTGVCKPAQKF
jgi:hypothetical protein